MCYSVELTNEIIMACDEAIDEDYAYNPEMLKHIKSIAYKVANSTATEAEKVSILEILNRARRDSI